MAHALAINTKCLVFFLPANLILPEPAHTSDASPTTAVNKLFPASLKKKGCTGHLYLFHYSFFFLHGEKKKHVPTVTSTKTRKYFWTHQMTLGEFSPETCSIVFHEIWNNHWFQQCADWAVIIYTCPLMTQSLMHGIHTHLKYIIIYSQYLLLSCIY